MNRLLYTLFLLIAIGAHVSARTPMRGWLTTMPDSVMSLLTRNNCLDFIDFYDAKMEAVVTNRLEGKSRMTSLSEDFVQISYTASTDVAMKLLPLNDSTDVLCMVTTVKTSVGDSRVAFYDNQWRQLDVASYITEPRIEDFCCTVHGDSSQWVWNKMDVFFRTYRLDAENTNLECVLTAPDYLSKEDREEVAPYVCQGPLVYRWTNGRYLRDE